MSFTPEIAAVYVQNAHRSLDLIHRALFAWGVGFVGLMALPSNGSLALNLSAFNASVPNSLFKLFLAFVIFFSSIVGSVALNNVRSIISNIPEEQEKAIRSYPSLATLGGSMLRFSVVGYLAMLQLGLGISPFYIEGQPIPGMLLVFALVYTMPMLVFTYQLCTWDKK